MNPSFHATCKQQIASVPVPRVGYVTAKALYCPTCQRELDPAELWPRGTGFVPDAYTKRVERYRLERA